MSNSAVVSTQPAPTSQMATAAFSPLHLDDGSKHNRRRGVVLTQHGWQKLVDAGALYDDVGKRYTHEELSERSLLDARTVSRILSCEVRVDKRTLKIFFHAFGVQLEKADFVMPNAPAVNVSVEQHLSRISTLEATNPTVEELLRLKQILTQDLERLLTSLETMRSPIA